MATLYTNNAVTTLNGAINGTTTTIVVSDGSVFPNPTGGDYFWLTLTDDTNIEIVQVTARSTNSLTVVRGQDGTSGTAFADGDKAQLRITAIGLGEFAQLTGATFTGGVDATDITASGQVSGGTGLIGDSTYQVYTSVGHLQISRTTTAGILLHSAATSSGYISFGDGAVAGRIQYNHNDDSMTFYTTNNVLALTLDSSQDATFAGAVAATGAVTGSNLNISNWDTAFGWGDHSSEGYATESWVTTTGHTFSGDVDFQRSTAGLLRYTFQNTDTSGQQQTDVHIATTGTTASDLYLGVNYTNGDATFQDARPANSGPHEFRYEGSRVAYYNTNGFRFEDSVEILPASDAGQVLSAQVSGGGRTLSLTAPIAANTNDPWVWNTANAIMWQTDSTDALEVNPNSHVEVHQRLIVNNSAAGGGSPAVRIETMNAATESDISLAGNAVVGGELSVTHTFESGGYIRFGQATASETGTAGFTEYARIDTTGLDVDTIGAVSNTSTVIRSNNTARLTIDNGGQFRAWSGGSVGAPQYSFSSYTSEGMGSSASTNVFLAANGNYMLLRENSTVWEQIMIANTGGDCAFYFGDAADSVRAGFTYDNSASTLNIQRYNNATAISITSSAMTIHGDVNFGTTTTESQITFNMDSSHAVRFMSSGTQVGDIGATDTTWLRINQNTAKNIYTPRYIRADGGFFVDGATYGVDGTGLIRANNGSVGAVAIGFGGDTNTGLYWKSSDTLGFVTGGAERGYWNSTSLYVNNVTLTSDVKLKKDIVDSEYGLAEVLQLKPRRYKWKEGGREEIGFIAQELEKILPELVHGDDTKGIDYPKLTAVLVRAIQELYNGNCCTCKSH